MNIINGVRMQNFKPDEFSENPERYASPVLLRNLQAYRNILGHKIYPSKADGALARFSGSRQSMHYIDPLINDDRSEAIDVFCDCDIFEAYNVALNSNLWGGVGVYFDTKRNGKPWPMLHLDTRKLPLMWFRWGKNYYYPHKSESFYGDLLSLFLIKNTTMGVKKIYG